MGPGDLTYPQHIEKGLSRYIQTAMGEQPDFSSINDIFSRMASSPGLLARGGSFVDPAAAQQFAAPNYLAARGNIAGNYYNNLMGLSRLAMLVGKNQGDIAALIPELQGMQAKTGGGMFSSLLGGL